MNANTETLIRRATRLVTNLRSARKYEDKAGRATATDHYLGAARAMLDDDSDSPRFYRICAAVAAEQGDTELSREITRVAEMAESAFALFKR